MVTLSLGGIGTASADRLEDVRQRGELNCGVNGDLPGFAQQDAGGTWHGLDIDLCRGVAAAVLGDAGRVRYFPINSANRFEALIAGDIDLLVRNTTWTLTRDLDEGVTFTVVNYYDGQGFLVAGDSSIRTALELQDARVCTIEATTSVKNAEGYFQLNRLAYSLTTYPDIKSAWRALEQGACNVLTGDISALYALRSGAADPAAYKVLPEVISKEPLGPVVREGDDKWAKIVRWTLYAMLNADELQITSANVDRVRAASEWPATRRFLGVEGESGKRLGLDREWAYRVIRQVGNYGESFERNLGSGSPLRMKRGLNANWREGGLHYPPSIQ